MNLLMVVIMLALAATVIVLLLGLMSMSHSSTDRVTSTPLMWARVGFQAFTILLLIGAVLLQ
jgi:FlaG/FlaF family flagellin (archaellin)